MKVLQINTVYRGGGSTGRIVYDLRCIQHESGIKDYVAYGYDTIQHSDQDTFRMQNYIERKIAILKCRLYPIHGFYNNHETNRLLIWIDKIKPDIIHLHNIHNHYLNVRMLFNYIKLNNIPVVWTLHDCWSFTGWCAYFDYVQCYKWKEQCNNCPNKHEYPFTWFFDLSKSNYMLKKNIFQGVKSLTLVTPSKWLANYICDSFLKNYPVMVIHNGVDTSIFCPQDNSITVKKKYGINHRKMILAMAMNLNRRKGIEYLLKLGEVLAEDECLVLVGGNINIMSNFNDQHCVCIKQTSNIQELASLYSAADVFVNLTLEDNFPTTNIEALACGTPVVTFNTGGSVESIDDKTGAIVERGDSKSLLDTIRAVISKGKKYYMNSCRMKALNFYDKGKQFRKYIDLYKEII